MHTNTPTWELIGDDNGLTWVYTNTHTWELTLIHLRGNAYVQWVYTNTHTRELNRYRPDQTGPDQTRQTQFKSFQCVGKKCCQNFGSLFHCWIPKTVVPEFIVASTICRHKIRVGNWEIKYIVFDFFNLLRGYEKGIFSKSDVGMSITILFLQTPQSDDKSSSVERKIPSLSLNLSRIHNSAAPQTNTTWWKLSVSAFQRYWGWGVSDRVYIGKSTISHVDTNGCWNF